MGFDYSIRCGEVGRYSDVDELPCPIERGLDAIFICWLAQCLNPFILETRTAQLMDSLPHHAPQQRMRVPASQNVLVNVLRSAVYWRMEQAKAQAIDLMSLCLLASKRSATVSTPRGRTPRSASVATATPQATKPARRKPGPQPGTEAARRGGTAARDKYGKDFYSRIGAKGGATVRDHRGSAFYTEIGRKGGESTKRVHGAEYYSSIGRIGGTRAHGTRPKADR